MRTRQDWVSREAESTQVAGDAFLEEPVTDIGPWSWSCFLPALSCHSDQGVPYLPKEASGHWCLGAGPDLTEPLRATRTESAFSLSAVLGAGSALLCCPRMPVGSVLLHFPAGHWTMHSDLCLRPSDLPSWPTAYLHKGPDSVYPSGLCKMQVWGLAWWSSG